MLRSRSLVSQEKGGFLRLRHRQAAGRDNKFGFYGAVEVVDCDLLLHEFVILAIKTGLVEPGKATI